MSVELEVEKGVMWQEVTVLGKSRRDGAVLPGRSRAVLPMSLSISVLTENWSSAFECQVGGRKECDVAGSNHF